MSVPETETSSELSRQLDEVSVDSADYSASEDGINLHTSVASVPEEGEGSRAGSRNASFVTRESELSLYSKSDLDSLLGRNAGQSELNPIFFHAIFSQFQSRCAWNIGNKLKNGTSINSSWLEDLASLGFYRHFQEMFVGFGPITLSTLVTFLEKWLPPEMENDSNRSFTTFLLMFDDEPKDTCLVHVKSAVRYIVFHTLFNLVRSLDNHVAFQKDTVDAIMKTCLDAFAPGGDSISAFKNVGTYRDMAAKTLGILSSDFMSNAVSMFYDRLEQCCRPKQKTFMDDAASVLPSMAYVILHDSVLTLHLRFLKNHGSQSPLAIQSQLEVINMAVQQTDWSEDDKLPVSVMSLFEILQVISKNRTFKSEALKILASILVRSPQTFFQEHFWPFFAKRVMRHIDEPRKCAHCADIVLRVLRGAHCPYELKVPMAHPYASISRKGESSSERRKRIAEVFKVVTRKKILSMLVKNH
eukprot:187749_1